MVKLWQCSECSARENASLVELISVTLNGWFGNASIMSVAVVLACVLSNSISGPICNCLFTSIATNTIHADFGDNFVCLAKRIICEEYCTFASHVPFPLFSSSDRSFLASIDASSEFLETIFRSGGKMDFTNLSMKEVHKTAGTSQFITAPKTTLTLESVIHICNVIVRTTLTFSLVALFNDAPFFSCVNFNLSVSRTSSRIRRVPAPVPKPLFTRCILLATTRMEIETLQFLLLNRRMSSVSSYRHI